MHDPHAHRAADTAPHRGHRVTRGIGGGQRPASLDDQRHAGVGEHDTVRGPVEQGVPSSRSKLRTDTDNADWTRWMRPAARVKLSFLGHGEEVLQMPKFHPNSSPVMLEIDDSMHSFRWTA